MKRNPKDTLAYVRFSSFVDQVKKAKNDHDIAQAGYDLVEEYRGFGWEWQAVAVQGILDEAFKVEEK